MALGLIFFFDLFFGRGGEGDHLKYFEREGGGGHPDRMTLWRLIDTKEKSSRTHVKENFWLVQIRLDKQRA